MQPLSRMSRSGRGNVGFNLPRIYPRQIALAVMVAMTSEVFYSFPGMAVPNELWNVVCFFFLCFVYLAWKVKSHARFMGFELYVLATMCITPIWAGVMAQHVFGQPAFYGILAERQVIVAVGALALLMFYRLGWIGSEDCRRTFLILAWGTLILYSIMTLSTYAQGVSGNVEGQGGGNLFTFNYAFVEIGFLYYALIGFKSRSYIHFILALPFLIYIISTGQRAQLLVTLGAYGLFVLLRGSFERLMVFLPSALVGFAAVVGTMYVLNPPYVTDLGIRIGQAITTVTTGQRTQDFSSNARLAETAVALPYVSNSLLVGNGDISHQWHGGYLGVLNAYFFPSDIGIIGVVYRFGVLGALFFAWQFWWMRKYAKAVSRGVGTAPMGDAVMAFLVAYAVISIESGMYVNQFPTGALLTVFLYIAATERKGPGMPPRRRKRRVRATDLQGLQQP